MGAKTGVNQTCVITWHVTSRCYTMNPPDGYVMMIRKSLTATDDSEDEEDDSDDNDKVMEAVEGVVP
jgi:hypothetical protein